MKYKNKTPRLIIVAISVLAVTTSLSGCGLTSSPTREEKTKTINKIADMIDYSSAGEILEKEYRVASSGIEPTSLNVKIKGSDAFSKIKENILNIDKIDCIPVNEGVETLSCNLNTIGIGLTVHNPEGEPTYTSLNIIDPKSGRDSQ